MKVLSLFSGVGGLDMGLENAGMETVFQCEWDKNCRTILDKHWSNVPKWDDVSTLTGEHIFAHAPVIDVVAWGSPCQDLSVAGKRAGLEGGRSGLFYEGMRIISELREASNGKYPRISIWENVYGALNSNKGDDFEAILKEMVEAGSLLCEWRVLDAQYFGVPQRRRRVFVVAVFDSATANRCPDPLLPVSEGLQWDPATSAKARQSSTDTASGSIGSGSAVTNTISASLYHHGTVVNQDANNGHVVIEPFTPSSFAQYEQGVGTLRSNGGDLGGGSETLLTEPYVKVVRSGARYPDGTLPADVWRKEQLAPTLNSFDMGDTRAVVAIVEPILLDGRRNDDVRVYTEPVQTLEARMGTGGNNVPMLAFSHTQGLDAQPSEKAWPTLRKEGNGHAVAIPIQDGRDIEKHQNGFGVAEEGAPSYTIDQTGAQAVAYGIQGNMIGRQDHNGPAGKGHTEEGDPMFTLTSNDIHAVAFQYDGYNQTVNTTDVSQSLRIGRDSSDFIAQLSEPTTNEIHTVAATLRSGGAGGVPSSRGEHLVAEPTMAVRRLTPLECERLMGWPDNHTLIKADGTEQADTHRYKQCGNGVASPVAQWIGEQLMNLELNKDA